jgi:hypothetical protein
MFKFKEVREVKIDTNKKEVMVKRRKFINADAVVLMEEEKTADKECPVVYRIHLADQNFLIGPKDFQKLLGNQVTEVLPAGSYKTL